MPGARLTHEDRRQIAVLLDEGVGYGEIGRRLGRPTSTISREVSRNARSGVYRADYAQQAAADRAPRRKPTRAVVGTDGRASRSFHMFTDEFATVLIATGLPRMSARVFACLLTSDSGNLTVTDLVHQLRVSPAAVSKAIGYLAGLNLVVRTPDPGSRRERYVIVEDVWRRAWRTDTGAHSRIADTARRGADLLGSNTPAGRRLHTMSQFFAWLSDQMGGSDLDGTVFHDARTVLAALVYAKGPLTAAGLGAALDLPAERVTAALSAIERNARFDPLTVITVSADTYTVAIRPELLTPDQRRALDCYRRGTV
jgi:DNA-binding transcriptional regulator GbsR (MarR family)